MSEHGTTPDPARGTAPTPGLRSMDCQEFINRLKGVCDEFGADGPSAERRYAFFLGAGCSVSSDIPSAGTLVRDHWIPRLCKIKHPGRRDHEAFAREAFDGYEPDNAAAYYGQLIDALFVTPNDRQTEIEQLCDDKFPGFGYAALAKLVAHRSTAFNVVLTTNFDDLMADALYLYTRARPLVIHHESLAAYIRPTRMRPLVVKLHGDSRLSPKNTHFETKSLHDDLAKHISMLLNDRGLIFMGYSGGDVSIHTLLDELPDEALPSGIFWLSLSEPQGEVRDWLSNRQGFWVPIKDFDEFMLRVHASFEMEHPSTDEFDKMFGQYYETFRKMGEKIDKPRDGQPDSVLARFLEAARDSLPGNYKNVAQGDALADSQPDEAERLLRRASNNPNGSVRSQLAAARSLRDRLFKFHESLLAFESALERTIRERGPQDEEVAWVRVELAHSRWLNGQQDRAAVEVAQAIDWAEAHASRDNDIFVVLYQTRAVIRLDLGDLDGAASDIARCIEYAELENFLNDRVRILLYNTRAGIRCEFNDFESAVSDIQRCIDWASVLVPEDDRMHAALYDTRASIRRGLGELDGAASDIAFSINWAQVQKPRNDRFLAMSRHVRAGIRSDLGDLDGAASDVAWSIEWFEQNQPENHSLGARFVRTQARILASLNRWDEAKQAIATSVDHHEQAFGPDHTWTQRARTWQADIAAKRVPLRWHETEPR